MLANIPSRHILKKNCISLLTTNQDELVKKLDHSKGWPPFEVVRDSSGKINLRLDGWNRSMVHDESNISSVLEELSLKTASGNTNIILLGIGLGYELDIAFRKFPGIRIIAYERYPEILKLALSLRDYSREILSGKLTFILDTDLTRYYKKPLPHLILHPVMGRIYEEEQIWWENFSCKFNIKCLVNSRGLLARDIVDTFLIMGVNAFPIDIISLDPREIIDQIKNFSPNFVMTINYIKGLPHICSKLGVPLVVWEIDPTLEVLSEKEAGKDNVFIHTYRKSRVSYFKELGFRNVWFLPLGTNPRRYRPIEPEEAIVDKYKADVSYVGSSMKNQAEWALKKAKMLLKRHYPSILPEQFLTEVIKRQVKNLDFYSLHKIIEKKLALMGYSHILEDEQGRKIDIILCLGEKIASFRRIKAINTLEDLARKKIVKVWGDEGWKDGLARSIVYSGPAGHFHELPLIYNASAVNLDINRIYQKDIVPLRIFDILACGAFVLADDSKELGGFFKKGEEIISYRKISQIPLICEYYLKNEKERKEIAEAGRNRVLKEHTLEHRLSFIIEKLKTN